MQFSFANRLLRAAPSLGFLLGFLGCLVAQENLSSQAAASEFLVTNEAVVGVFEATPNFCGSRFAALNNSPVRPWAIFAGTTYQRGASRFNCCESMLTEQMGIGQPDDFGVACEDDDSIEMLRVDIRQRTFDIDRVVIGPKVLLQAARNTRANISPPLLV